MKGSREKTRGARVHLHDGPPYANRHIHLGHVLNKVLKGYCHQVPLHVRL